MCMALRGAGIATIHDPFAAPHRERGELFQVLSDWSTHGSPLQPSFSRAD
jgi:hypothetical protein